MGNDGRRTMIGRHSGEMRRAEGGLIWSGWGIGRVWEWGMYWKKKMWDDAWMIERSIEDLGKYIPDGGRRIGGSCGKEKRKKRSALEEWK